MLFLVSKNVAYSKTSVESEHEFEVLYGSIVNFKLNKCKSCVKIPSDLI